MLNYGSGFLLPILLFIKNSKKISEKNQILYIITDLLPIFQHIFFIGLQNVHSVADLGSSAFLLLDPGSGTGFFRIADPGSKLIFLA
jgi:hypothetical protein